MITFEECLQFLIGGEGMARLSLILNPLNHILCIDPLILRNFFRTMNSSKQADIGYA